MLACVECKCIIDNRDILICDTCLKSKVIFNRYKKLHQCFLFFKEHESIDALKHINKKLHNFVRKLGFLKTKSYFNNFFLKQKDEYFERELRAYFLASKMHCMDEEVKKYFKKKYKNRTNYFIKNGYLVTKKNFVNLMTEIHNRYNGYLTKEIIKSENPLLWKHIKKLTIKTAEYVCGFTIIEKEKNNKKFSYEENKQNLNKFIIKVCGVLNPKSTQEFKNILGCSFCNEAIKEIRDDFKFNFFEFAERTYKREFTRQSGIRVEEHSKLIHHIIRKKFSFCVQNPELYSDAFSSGYEGLLHAAAKYDPKRGEWSTCAWNWIESKIRRYFEQNNPNSSIRIPSHRQNDKELMEASLTLSLDKKNVDGENGSSFENLTCDLDNVEITVETNDVYERIGKVFGEETMNNFKNYTLHRCSWKGCKRILMEVKKYVAKEFYSDIKFNY